MTRKNTAPRAVSATKHTTTLDGHEVTIWDRRTNCRPRFAAHFTALSAYLVGRGETREEALAALRRTAVESGEHRR
jgi:hypothetical protein